MNTAISLRISLPGLITRVHPGDAQSGDISPASACGSTNKADLLSPGRNSRI